MKYTNIPLLIIIIFCVLVGCTTEAPEFDSVRAFGYIEKQVAFGPRVPGTLAWDSCRTWMVEQLSSTGLEIDSQVFDFMDPYSGQKIPLVNLIARLRGGRDDEKGILLVAHWDSRPRIDYHQDPELGAILGLDGANDGASGTAVLLELANLMVSDPPNINLDLVFVDGEDWGKPGDDEYYCIGSQHFAKKGIRNKYHFGIVIDLIGDKNQQIFREKTSDRFSSHINDMIWSVAAELDISTLHDSIKYEIRDDHIPLNIGGVPSVVVIDFDYSFWHTEFDTPDKCSAESLGNIGRILAHILYNKSLWP